MEDPKQKGEMWRGLTGTKLPAAVPRLPQALLTSWPLLSPAKQSSFEV